MVGGERGDPIIRSMLFVDQLDFLTRMGGKQERGEGLVVKGGKVDGRNGVIFGGSQNQSK